MSKITQGIDPKVHSKPLELDWYGWRSNTAILQQCGWRIAASEIQDILRIQIQHPELGVFGMSDSINISRRYRHSQYSERERGYYSLKNRFQNQDLNIQMARELRIMQSEPVQWHAIDAQPSTRAVDIREEHYYRGKIPTWFRRMEEPKGKEFYFNKATVSEILEFAAAKQEPDQARIRDRILRERESARFAASIMAI